MREGAVVECCDGRMIRRRIAHGSCAIPPTVLCAMALIRPSVVLSHGKDSRVANLRHI